MTNLGLHTQEISDGFLRVVPEISFPQFNDRDSEGCKQLGLGRTKGEDR